jgi:hypothetical protein
MTLNERLIEAEDAYHQIMTGQSVVEFRDQNGELVRYSAVNANRLAAYIQSLKIQLGQTGSAPMGVWYL